MGIYRSATAANVSLRFVSYSRTKCLEFSLHWTRRNGRTARRNQKTRPQWISSAWFAFGSKADIIKGMAMEDDWVVMNEDYLKELEANIKEDTGPPDMGLFFDLNTEKWTKKGSPPGGKAKLGYIEYNITQVDNISETELEVQIAKTANVATSGQSVKIIDVVWNCFRSTPTCFLKLNKGLIIGIMTKDDWIIIKK